MLRRVPAFVMLLAAALLGQDQKSQSTQSQPKQQKQELKKERPQPKTSEEQALPPEEDNSIAVTEYSFNPLQAEKELKVGNFYFKKGAYRAAASRFREAVKWNDGYGEAWLRLGEAEEKLKDKHAALQAYTKYLKVDAEAKDAAEIRKRIGKLK